MLKDTSQQPLTYVDYTVACIYFIEVKLTSIEGILDEIYDPLPTDRDQNAYTLKKIDEHSVVMTILFEIENSATTTMTTQLFNDFPSIRFGLLVGIGGEVSENESKDNVRLDDIIMSQPTVIFRDVVQYDLKKRLVDRSFERTK